VVAGWVWSTRSNGAQIWGEQYQRCGSAISQILSIAQLLAGKKIDYPRFAADATFKKAPKARMRAEEQIPLDGTEIKEQF